MSLPHSRVRLVCHTLSRHSKIVCKIGGHVYYSGCMHICVHAPTHVCMLQFLLPNARNLLLSLWFDIPLTLSQLPNDRLSSLKMEGILDTPNAVHVCVEG